MISTISRRKAITYMLIIASVILMVCIWPLKLIRFGYTAKSDEIMVSESDPISVEYNMTQMFDGVYGELKSVDLYVCNDMSDQIMTFRLYDEEHKQIYEQFYSVPTDFIAPGFVHIPIRYDMEEGLEYSFIIEGLTTDLYAAYEDRDTTTSPVNYFMAYGGAVVPEYDLIVRYNYACPFKLWQGLVTLAALAAVCVATWFALGKVEDKEISIKRTLQFVVYPILAICALVLAYIILKAKLFGFDTKNNLFVLMGFWMLLAVVGVILYVGEIAVPENWKEKLKNIPISRVIRVVSIATVLWYCYEYMNGLYDIFHYHSTVKMLIAFSFLLISTYRKKEVLNIPNAIWLIAGPIVGYFVYHSYVGEELEVELWRLYGWLVAVGGFVVINIVYSIILLARKKIKMSKVNLWFAIPFAVLAIGMIILANGRNWVWQLMLIITLLGYRLCVMENSELFTRDLCAGIVLNFYMMVWYSLRHRPYYYYIFYRYNMGYHTVTVTAYYLALIITAAWMRLFKAYHDNKSKINIIVKLFTFGMSVSYLLFTMSRTGFLSVGTMVIFALIAVLAIYIKENRLKYAAKFAGIMIVAVVYMFPITFSLTDIMPRVSNDPILVTEVEERSFSFSKGMPYADANYMTIEQFAREFCKKVFGIESDKLAQVELSNPLVMKAYAAEETDSSSSDVAQPAENTDEEEDLSNGRFDIFRSYIAEWNLWGHDKMGATLPDGEIAIHAHNSFLQVAHDHGIVFGVYFVLFTGYVIILSLYRAYKRKEDLDRVYCAVIVVAFGMASLVEWIMHMCNPFGLAIFMAMMPMIIKDSSNEKNN